MVPVTVPSTFTNKGIHWIPSSHRQVGPEHLVQPGDGLAGEFVGACPGALAFRGGKKQRGVCCWLTQPGWLKFKLSIGSHV